MAYFVRMVPQTLSDVLRVDKTANEYRKSRIEIMRFVNVANE
jgi:hypothetical protein